MRKWMMMLLILGLLTVPVLGAEAEAEAVLEGVPQEVRESPGITLRGPKGEVHLDHGVIVAQRHIHMPPEEAAARGLTDGQVVLESEYVLFARARGESSGTILRRHGLRNILLPALTLQFASFAELFGGSVLAETVFSYPGLGSAVAAAGLNSDVPLLLGITLFSTLFVCTGNLIANLLYGVVDPQIKEVNS